MKKSLIQTIIITIIVVIPFNNLLAQILHPVHWSYAAKKINKRGAVIFIKATMNEGWHIYSVNQKDGGPLKTSIEFNPSKAYQLIGEIVEPSFITKYEKVFNIDVHYFENTVIFQQKIALTSSDAVVRGKINFMTCNDEKCLPPDEITFHIAVK